jgi:hypothetical protein
MLSRSLRIALAGFAVLLVAAGTAGAEAPQLNTPATVTGSPSVGSQLTAHNGTWLYDNGTSCGSECQMTYVWQRCNAGGTSCSDIGGATGRFYTVQAADSGSRLRVMETMTKHDCGAHNTQTGTIECRDVSKSGPSGMTAVVGGTAPSAPSAPAPAQPSGPPAQAPLAPSPSAAPTVAGLAMVDQTLTATAGTWSGTQPLTLRLEWLRCDAAGQSCQGLGITGSSYRVLRVDIGRTLRVKVVAANPTAAREALSDATAVVSELRPTENAPTIAAAGVAAPYRLAIDAVSTTPTRFRSRGTLTVSLRVRDTRGFLVEGALVRAQVLPTNAVRSPGDVATGADGTVTLTFTRGAKLKPRVKALTIVLIARRPGDKLTSPRGAIVKLRVPVGYAAARRQARH